MTAWRLLFLAYLIALTVAIVHPQGGQSTDVAAASVGAHPDFQHFLAFLVLAILAGLARFGLPISCLATALVVYSVAGELVQALVPTRTVSLFDGGANVLGVLLGCGLIVALRRR